MPCSFCDGELEERLVQHGYRWEGKLFVFEDVPARVCRQCGEKHFDAKVYNTVIRRSIKLSEAPSFGKPIALYDKDSIGAAQYHELTREILKRSENTVLRRIPDTEPDKVEETEYGTKTG